MQFWLHMNKWAITVSTKKSKNVNCQRGDIIKAYLQHQTATLELKKTKTDIEEQEIKKVINGSSWSNMES